MYSRHMCQCVCAHGMLVGVCAWRTLLCWVSLMKQPLTSVVSLLGVRGCPVRWPQGLCVYYAYFCGCNRWECVQVCVKVAYACMYIKCADVYIYCIYYFLFSLICSLYRRIFFVFLTIGPQWKYVNFIVLSSTFSIYVFVAGITSQIYKNVN